MQELAVILFSLYAYGKLSYFFCNGRDINMCDINFTYWSGTEKLSKNALSVSKFYRLVSIKMQQNKVVLFSFGV